MLDREKLSVTESLITNYLLSALVNAEVISEEIGAEASNRILLTTEAVDEAA